MQEGLSSCGEADGFELHERVGYHPHGDEFGDKFVASCLICGKSRDRAHPVIRSFARSSTNCVRPTTGRKNCCLSVVWTSSSETNHNHFAETGSWDSA